MEAVAVWGPLCAWTGGGSVLYAAEDGYFALAYGDTDGCGYYYANVGVDELLCGDFRYPRMKLWVPGGKGQLQRQWALDDGFGIRFPNHVAMKPRHERGTHEWATRRGHEWGIRRRFYL